MATTKGILAGITATALLVAAPAFALSVSAVTTGNTAVSVGTGVNVTVGASSSANSSSGSSNASAGTNASTDLSVPLVISQADISAGAAQQANVSADNVQTKTDLSNFISTKLRADANLSSVDTATDHVAVTYQEPVRLFGFLPISAAVTATTDASGNVTISKPWWGFLAASDETNLQSNVQASVNAVLGSDASANAQLTASQQAQLESAIESAMAANASASANTTASAQ